MISVIIPLYNKEQSIARTLQTVLNQTFQDYEIIIVNDGSTDNSLEETRKVSDSRIRIINQENAGVSAARNRGIEEAKYDLIAFLDADDEWMPDYLETQYKLYKKYPECEVFACNYEFRDNSGKITHTIIKKLPFTGEDGILTNYFEVASCSHPPIWTSAVAVKKNAIENIGGFPVSIKSGEDLLTWARLAARYKIAYSTKISATYCIRRENLEDLDTVRKSAPADLKTTHDKVGAGLLELYHEGYLSPRQKPIRIYISYWYKMRAIINLRLRYRIPAIKCAFKSIYYDKQNFKAYVIIFLSLFCPYFIIKHI